MNLSLLRPVWIILFSVMLNSLWANGGPIDYAAIERTGNVQLMEEHGVKLISEDLSITLEREYVHVVAVYRLRSSWRDESVEYGFPIDVGIDEAAGSPVWQETFIKDFQWRLDRDVLDHELHQDRTHFAYRREENGETVEIPFRRFWYLGKLGLKKGETHTLRVSYRIKPRHTDWETSKDLFPSYDLRDFVYDLRPAGYWDSESMERLSMKVDVGKAIRCGRVVWVKGLEDLKRVSATEYQMELTNGPMPEAFLDLRYDVSGCLLTDDIRAELLPKDRIQELKASSQLEGNYDLENLIDMDFGTAWVEGVDATGIGEWTQFSFHEGTRVRGVMLMNGYLKSESTYLANSRLRRVRVEYEMRFSEDEEFRKEEIEVDLPDLPFRELTQENYGVQTHTLVEFGDYAPYMRRVRISILDTYPGTKYEDTCISEVILIGE